MNTKTQRWWDIPAALFLLGALFSAAVRLNATNWTEELGRVQLVVLLGAILGFALGKSIFSGRVTFGMGLVYSVFAIPWMLGLLMPAGGDWSFRLQLLYARLYWTTADFIRNQPVTDSILFITTMITLYWIASLLSAYRLVRHANPWLPLLALGGMILVIEYTMELYRFTTISGGFFSFLYLVFCLILMGRLYYLKSKKEWEQRGGTVELEVGYDLGRGVMVSALILALLAWNTPRLINVFAADSPAQERISRTWQSIKDRISKAVNPLTSPAPMVVEGYGNNMFLGTGGILGDETVFTVELEGVNARPSGRYYWAARTYDTYLTNGQWEASTAESQEIGPDRGQLSIPRWNLRKEMTFEFTSSIPLLQTLYHPSETISVSRPTVAVVGPTDEEDRVDLNTLVIDPPLESGETYTILASIAQPNIRAMQRSSTEYPEWVKARYLQLPEGFSPRIADLALEVAGSEETVYDKAQAITQYLRRTITYTQTVPEPPRDRDPLEWFLFDLRSGFCNYYASAEVLMLRSLGIPARLVVGYAEGTWDPEADLFTVIGKDSHAWPEVYFPNVGWVAFEPTVSQPTVNFPSGVLPNSGGEIGASLDEPFVDEGLLPDQPVNPAQDIINRANQQVEGRAPISPWTIAAMMGAVALGILALLEWRRRQMMTMPLPSWIEKSLDERGFRTPGWLRMWSQRSLRTPMENLFANVGLMLRIWGKKVDPSQTPLEQVDMLVKTVPGVEQVAVTLLEEYQRAMYSPYPANLIKAKKAVDELRSVGLKNWALRLVGLET